MRRTGTDLMATGVIVGSTALAVAGTLAFARANSGETQDTTAECTPFEARWAVAYAVTVDGAAEKSTPAKWRLHTGIQVPGASHAATHRCRHLTVVAPRMKLISDRLTLELGEAAERTAVTAARAEAARVQAEGVRKRLEEFKELAEERRRLQETVLKQLEAKSAGER